MKGTAVLVHGGGNKVFFANGILQGIHEDKIHVDHIMGYSAGSAVVMSYIMQCNENILEIFGKRLDENKKNYYLSKPYFPHTGIYKESIEEMFDIYNDKKRADVGYSVIAAKTQVTLANLKGALSTALVYLQNKHQREILKVLVHLCGIKPHLVTNLDEIEDKSLIKLIVGSSTLYPFIELQKQNGVVLLEGSLVRDVLINDLVSYNKRIEIHNHRGTTEVIDDTLHIYSPKEISSGALDYTSSKPILSLHELGLQTYVREKDNIIEYLQ